MVAKLFTKYALRTTLGVGAGALSCYGVVKFLNDQNQEVYVPISKRGISSSKKTYDKGSFASTMIDSGHGDLYLGTGPENKELWEKLWKQWEKDPDKKKKLDTAKVTSGFSDMADNASSLNGLCESIYKGKEQGPQLSWVCMTSFARVLV